MKRTLLVITCVLASITMLAQEGANDYLPFVELGKQWYVVSKNENPNYVSRWERYWMFEKVERGGKTYVHVYLNNDILCTSKEEGLFREEGRMVYKYDETTGRDVMLYDFSLKEGDTFTYEYGFDHPVNCKVLKQGWLKDGPQIVSSITRVSADSLDVKYRRLRTWTIGREGTDGQYQEVTTWVEGIGAFENMFSPLNMNKEGKSCLAYVKRDESISDYFKNAYLPFSFSNISDVFGQIHGCNLPTGAEDNWESDGRHQLTYELEGDRLHVYGKVFTQCGPNNYAFFYEKPTDDPLVHKIEFIIQEVEPTMDCMALHQTDFYVPGFDPNMNYIVVDNQGEEHPVINENPQMAYLPFVEEGKVWRTFASYLSSKGYKVKCYFSGEEIKGGKTYSVMYGQKEKETPYRIGLYREENKKVYEYNEKSGTEYVIYDFSLKVGDEFTSTIPFVKHFRVESEGEKVVNGYHLRTLRLVSEDPDYNDVLYWIEGLGGEDGPFGGLSSARPISERVNIAYVQYMQSDFAYIPFYFVDINHEWHGAPALLGEKNNEAYEEVGLKYEIVGSRLHVYGYIWASPGSSNYLFIKEEETDDPKSLLLRVEREYTNAVLTANMGVYYIDLYSSEYGMYYNYKVVDEFGEHDVVNRNYEYRPFVEEGKAWKVGALNSGNPVQFVEYYYFDGDTIINGKTCKQMMCQLYVSTDFPEYIYYSQHPSLSYVGAWYEENQKVYFCNATNNQFKLMYDFSIDENDILLIDNHRYVIEPKQTGGINGFKGVYRKVRLWEDGESYKCAPWMEGVGVIYAPPTTNIFNLELADPLWFLMSCTVGDEVIYCNSEVDDPFNMGTKKRRFDFNHTIKTQPKTPRRAGELDGLYGEYNNELLDVKLNPLDDAYLVRITDKSGKAVYEKTINAGNIVALNIDISAYPEGQYTVTIENSKETFTGEFDTTATGIEKNVKIERLKNANIYNLQGQRIKMLQKGLNIVDGKKVWVK